MSQTNILLDAGTNELEVVEFYLDEEGYRGHYGVNVAKVLEIIREQPVTAMPQMRHPAVLGAFPHRDGRVVPLVDLALYLGKKRAATQEPKIIVTEFNNIITGFLVSGVNRIHRLSWQEVEAPGSFLQNMSRNAITGVVRLEGRVVFILDMEAIVGELDPALAIRLDGALHDASGKGTIYTVLHADDSGNVRNLVKRLMEQSGRFKIIQTSNGEEAWNTLLRFRREEEQGGTPVKQRVQAVISDIEMPQMDGLTLCRKIKEDATLKYLPVALFSSLITDRLEHKGESVGADAQFAKPDLQVLSEKVLELITTGKVKSLPSDAFL
ncbi:putative CheW protein [uncultured delta proteobacterium]|uniref:Putative CheW protein n=1 Tax=uncultured delta proteobacterium TaxID=34034 RepID=A0A212JGS5_9DELT|nr:putative CheW protein [uncultured delta proteobacterium]